MPEHLRSLVVILFIATVFFTFARRTACEVIKPSDFTRRRNLWFGLTLAAFLAHNFWLYSLIAVVLLIYSSKREINPLALYFFLLFVMPMSAIQIPGMGLINFLFEITHQRILALFILLPLFLTLRRQGGYLSFGRIFADKAIAAYLVLTIVLQLRDSSLTNILRETFYLFMDVFLPYIVISRSLKQIQVFRDALMSFVLALMVVAALAIFEFSKHWILFSPLIGVLNLEGSLIYLGRDGMLRATVIAGEAIALGYLMVVGMGLYLFVQRNIQKDTIRWLGFFLLTAGLIAPLSRGPWIGAVLLIIIFIATGPYALRRLMSLVLAAAFAFLVVSMLPGGERVVNLLPFIGSTEEGNINYREQLITNSLIIIKRYLWFGSVDYMNTPEMEAMRQGQGIIDIVNTYIRVALQKGLVGLGLFVSFFAIAILGIYQAMRSISDKNSEECLLGRALLATLLAILVMIFTVSSVTFIPIIYWSIAGMGVAYTQMVRQNSA